MTSSTDGSEAVHVVVSLRARPGAAERVVELFAPLVEATRKEAACVRYELYRGVEDADALVLVELWRDQAGLDAHLQLPHVRGLLAGLGELVAEPPRIQKLAARG